VHSTCLPESTKQPTKLLLYYPIHDCPDSIIQVLVECYPQSLALPMDPKRRLPLHLACIHGISSIIPFLLQHNPNAVQQCDNCNRLPLHYASNNLPKITTEMLQQLINKWQELCFEFCIEQDLIDSDDNRYILEED